MREIFNRIWTRPSYGFGAMIVTTVLSLFVWFCASKESFIETIGGFILNMKQLVFSVIGFIIAIFLIKFLGKLLLDNLSGKKKGGHP